MSIEKYVVTFFSWSNKNFALEKLYLLKVKSSYPTHPTDSYVTYFSKNFISTVGFTRLYLLMAKQWSPKLSSLTFKSTHPTHPTHPIHPTDSYVTYFSRSFITTLGFTRLYLLMAKQWSAKLSSLTFKSTHPTYPIHPTDSYVTYFSRSFITTLGFTRLYLLMVEPWSARLSSVTFKSTHPTYPIHPRDSYVTYFSRSFITTLGFTRLYLLVVVPWSAKYVDQSSFNSKSINWLATENKQTVHHHYSGSSLLDSNLTMPVTFKLCYVFSRQS